MRLFFGFKTQYIHRRTTGKLLTNSFQMGVIFFGKIMYTRNVLIERIDIGTNSTDEISKSAKAYQQHINKITDVVIAIQDSSKLKSDAIIDEEQS